MDYEWDAYCQYGYKGCMDQCCGCLDNPHYRYKNACARNDKARAARLFPYAWIGSPWSPIIGLLISIVTVIIALIVL